MRDATSSGTQDTLAPHVLVVGSGAAGLTTALRAVARGARVTVVTKSALEHTATGRAQGGIAAMTRDLPGGQPLDSPQLHARDTRAAGAGLYDAEAVRGVVVRARHRIRRPSPGDPRRVRGPQPPDRCARGGARRPRAHRVLRRPLPCRPRTRPGTSPVPRNP